MQVLAISRSTAAAPHGVFDLLRDRLLDRIDGRRRGGLGLDFALGDKMCSITFSCRANTSWSPMYRGSSGRQEISWAIS